MYAQAHDIPVHDVDEYVSRNPEQRRTDKEERGKDGGGRACNAFILYRHCYQKVAAQLKGEVKQNNISSIVGDSWRNELPEISQKFRNAFMVEKARHADAFGIVKYNPSKPGTKGNKKVKSGDRVVSGRISKPPRSRKPARSGVELQSRFSMRSPEPMYFLSDRPPSGELPSLSYQGTPLTSSISTPAPEELMYQESLGMGPDPFAQGQCLPAGFPGHDPYGNPMMFPPQQVYQPYAVVPPGNPPYYGNPLTSTGAYCPPSNYPSPTQGSRNPYGFAVATSHDHLAVAGLNQPGPVLRNVETDHAGYLNPRDLSVAPAVPLIDPDLNELFPQDQSDMVQPNYNDTAAFSLEGDVNYLRFDTWEADSNGF